MAEARVTGGTAALGNLGYLAHQQEDLGCAVEHICPMLVPVLVSLKGRSSDLQPATVIVFHPMEALIDRRPQPTWALQCIWCQLRWCSFKLLVCLVSTALFYLNMRCQLSTRPTASYSFSVCCLHPGYGEMRLKQQGCEAAVAALRLMLTLLGLVCAVQVPHCVLIGALVKA